MSERYDFSKHLNFRIRQNSKLLIDNQTVFKNTKAVFVFCKILRKSDPISPQKLLLRADFAHGSSDVTHSGPKNMDARFGGRLIANGKSSLGGGKRERRERLTTYDIPAPIHKIGNFK